MPSLIGPPSHHEEPEGLRQAKRSKRREEKRVSAKGYRVSFGDVESVLKLSSGNGCMT